MQPKIDVSVIIPVFNAQTSIDHLVHELLSEQTLNIEVIVVDDGSTDETSTILNAITDERLILVHQENQGVYAARNTALAVHGGEWVVFLDADDRIDEGFLRERLKSARENQADVALFNGWHTDSCCLQRRPVHRKQPCGYALNGHAWIQHCVAQKEWPHYLWLQMVRSSYIRKNNLHFQEGKSHKDILWTINLAAANGRFYFSDRKDYFYITNPVSITHRQDYYDIRAHSYIDVISAILALSSLPQHHEIRKPLRRHALVECRHFLGLYRRKIANRQAARMRFRQRIALRQLVAGASSLRDVFFLLKFMRKIYL
ncbi:glycosyltransferase [Yokenella regensburgei]|uniref:PGL/p-HBAD biosynthesis glycosyltransferase Rv2957/MT3031 n=1 Tax=Yokenella regensburgei TaxID=158877 RepID=A0AB38FVQ5_9ENTR|nr:glycosyltransferase [Yokenella regensburgei]KFD25298.1 beta-1,3-glucosyltransferase [Yokenella regensburgei ATCC 49455]SQA63334.1 PGL/p-HBAD biosynthesis glycosyltransferase Rv2957/MT3031 [Yokenella regensburgei]SQA68754.1 PGL/p-HBAD biosynthesis glycosyltransferase Rv2957/MT3031 [Yokenella regensburgei]SUQ07069.1 PGL/p-HBAD biosynthesis glycosyltransferase Rv2957/MT3031 [Yokenella regensburgei]